MVAHRPGQQRGMALTTGVVEDNASDPDSGIKPGKPGHKCGGAGRHTPHIHHQQYRRAGQAGDLSSAPFTGGAKTVKKPHDPFNDRYVRITAVMMKRLLDKGRRTDPGIQIDGGMAGDKPVIARIDKIRPGLEGRHPLTASRKSSKQPQGNGGFT